ncbi:hypothetical protein [Chitinophaga sp. S165]|uniref:hypothetical protein n=1 Tax=Chitinophaga sp. S165 TaxID=2135462 RepID=UPI000D71693C|nr:hypothetical protein [Chitinophaga sp. S165]PWV49135.1 hypothetical protein C7475_106381 [Chitinophaga sp. S165]
MRKIVLHTFVAVLLASSVIAFCLLSSTGGAAIFVLLLLLLCAPFPTFLTVLIYNFLKRKILPNNRVFTVILSTLLLLAIYHICVVLFIIIFDSGVRSTTIDTMTDEYTNEYLVINIIATLLIICIPIAEIVIEKVKRDMKEELEKLEKKNNTNRI